MFISDLNYLEVVAEGNQIEGGSYYYYRASDADAKAKANAQALFGKYNDAYTKTYASAYAGPYYAEASSKSVASASSYGW